MVGQYKSDRSSVIIYRVKIFPVNSLVLELSNISIFYPYTYVSSDAVFSIRPEIPSTFFFSPDFHTSTLPFKIVKMSSSQCFENPPTLSSTCGTGTVQEFGGLQTYITGSPDSKLAILLISDVFGTTPSYLCFLLHYNMYVNVVFLNL